MLVRKLQHLFPAAVLLFAGLHGFIGEPQGSGLILSILQVVVGALMLAAMIWKTQISCATR